MSEVSGGGGSIIKSIQRVSASMNAGAGANVTISAIDPAKSRVQIIGSAASASGGQYYGSDSARITSATNVNFNNANFAFSTLYAQVVEYV